MNSFVYWLQPFSHQLRNTSSICSILECTILSIFLFALQSCDHHPIINLITPKDSATFHAGDSVIIKADLDDPGALFSVVCYVTYGNNFTDTVIDFYDPRKNGALNGYHLEKGFTTKAATEYKIQVGGQGEDQFGLTTIHIFSQ